ncbi:MAG: hypothetical protein ABI347_03420 [Nitrososphaera sp.]|jgi:hypothetical protein
MQERSNVAGGFSTEGKNVWARRFMAAAIISPFVEPIRASIFATLAGGAGFLAAYRTKRSRFAKSQKRGSRLDTAEAA